MDNLRAKIIKALIRIEKGSYSSLLLDSLLTDIKDGRDKALFTEVFYGVIRNKLYLDYIISSFSNISLAKMDREVLIGLRIGVYQLFFLDRIPGRAAIYESVEAVKILLPKNKKGAISFTNGILRNIKRREKSFKLPDKDKNLRKYLSIKYSYPFWLLDKFIAQYGIEKTEMILKATNKRADVIYRHNSLKMSKNKFIHFMKKDEIDYQKTYLDSFYKINSKNSPAETEVFKKGGAYIQGLSAGIASLLLDVKKGMAVLDLAAAPGGKTTHLAELMANTGQITAVDKNYSRLKLIDENSKRLGVKNIKTIKADAVKYQDDKRYDRILADLPCSGFGLISSKPEMKWQKDQSIIKKMADLQYKILNNNLNKLKVGGKLLYSTCTLTKEENQDLIEKIITENDNLKLIDINKKFKEITNLKIENNNKYLELLPGEVDSEGFFYALIQKME